MIIKIINIWKYYDYKNINYNFINLIVMNGLKYNNEKALKYSKQLLIDSEQEFKISFTNLSNSTKYVAYYVIG